ncbi:hypothetical protein MMC21_002586 [Puttea exsequens]|nr:hypothetical protein [Puttea exsequens]
MAVFESDQHAFEAKTQYEAPNQLDLKSHENSLSNGHHDISLPIAPSLNTSAHDNNNLTKPAIMNGFSHEKLASGNQTSFDLSPSLPNSDETRESNLNTSSQSAPDDVQDLSNKSVLETLVDSSTVIVEQPTSDLREDIQPSSVEETAEIKEQKQQQDLISDPELASETMDGTTDPLASVAQSHLPLLEPALQVEQTLSTTLSAPTTESLEIPPAAEVPASAGLEPIKTIEVEDTANLPSADISAPLAAGLPDAAAVEAPIDPPPTPALQATTESSESKVQEPAPVDQVMQDAPQSPAKVVREREEDDAEDAPAAKRVRTDEGAEASTGFKVPERPAIDTHINDTFSEATAKSTAPITTPQYKAIQRVMANIKRIQSSAAFRLPVDIVALNIPNYPNVVSKPMDLKTLEENLRAGKYSSVDSFATDFNLIVDNCKAFNGPEHSVTKAGMDMRASFEKQMKNVPGPEVAEPSPGEKRKKSVAPTIAKISQPRRESRSLPGSARSPVSASSPQTFALGPQGVPLIRRDSTVGDGRPKREIHPPAPRDLPYTNQKPKKKKFQWELKFCDHVLKELEKPKYTTLSGPFMQPVDPVALNIPSYHSIIKKPIDFGTMRSKLNGGEYENAKEFEADARLVFQNCYKFNKPGEPVNVMGHNFEEIFDSEWAKKRDWIEANTPASGAQTPGSSDDEDSEEEEEEEEDDEDLDQLSLLQKQIAAMSKQVELIQQKKKSPPVSNKKAAKAVKPVRRDSKKSSAPAKPEKKAAAKPAKKEKTPYVTYEQKQDISNRINSLSEAKMATALKIIRDSMPGLKGVQDDELELDIDELSDEVLHKLLVFVRKHVPRADDSPARPVPSTAAAVPPRKKNKPMSKHEQEARIAQVQSGLSAFQNPGAASSYDSMLGNESSDGADTSESEEE